MQAYSEELGQVLKGLMEFNPYFRLTPKECLKSPLFDKIRVPILERDAPLKIFLDIDKDDAFDYHTQQSKEFTMPRLRQILLEEIHKVKNDFAQFSP